MATHKVSCKNSASPTGFRIDVFAYLDILLEARVTTIVIPLYIAREIYRVLVGTRPGLIPKGG